MKFFVANWKMNHAFDETDEWLDVFFRNFLYNSRNLKDKEIVVCPPVFLLDYFDTELMEDSLKYFEILVKETGKPADEFTPQELNEVLLRDRPIHLGAQDCHHEESGSFTGDVSANMLTKVGCEYVILGHCERRSCHGESNEIVAKKLAIAAKNNLNPILCIGENKEVRDANNHLNFVREQLLHSIPRDVNFERLVIAYEPIWSIGTGVVPTLAQIEEMVNFIRKVVHEFFNDKIDHFFVLYGGSVNSKNSAEILTVENVDGFLIGKASLDPIEFLKICDINPKI